MPCLPLLTHNSSQDLRRQLHAKHRQQAHIHNITIHSPAPLFELSHNLIPAWPSPPRSIDYTCCTAGPVCKSRLTAYEYNQACVQPCAAISLPAPEIDLDKLSYPKFGRVQYLGHPLFAPSILETLSLQIDRRTSYRNTFIHVQIEPNKPSSKRRFPSSSNGLRRLRNSFPFTRFRMYRV